MGTLAKILTGIYIGIQAIFLIIWVVIVFGTSDMD